MVDRIIACLRCLRRGECEDPRKVPNTICAVYQLDWTLEEKVSFLRERGQLRGGEVPEELKDIHQRCLEAREKIEQNARRCHELMRGAPEPQATLLRLSGL
jgi:hypothetical protein